MKIRLIIQDRTWEYQLRAKRQQPGCYYVELCDLAGGSLKPAVFTGSFATLDQIVEEAPGIMLQLVGMRESGRPGPDAPVAIIEPPHRVEDAPVPA